MTQDEGVEVRALRRRGWTVSAIARHHGRSRHHHPGVPERHPGRPRGARAVRARAPPCGSTRRASVVRDDARELGYVDAFSNVQRPSIR